MKADGTLAIDFDANASKAAASIERLLIKPILVTVRRRSGGPRGSIDGNSLEKADS